MANNGHFDGSEDENYASEDDSCSLYSFNLVKLVVCLCIFYLCSFSPYSEVQLSVGPCSFLHFLVWFKFHIASN